MNLINIYNIPKYPTECNHLLIQQDIPSRMCPICKIRYYSKTNDK